MSGDDDEYDSTSSFWKSSATAFSSEKIIEQEGDDNDSNGEMKEEFY